MFKRCRKGRNRMHIKTLKDAGTKAFDFIIPASEM